jgi:hypothetical protein
MGVIPGAKGLRLDRTLQAAEVAEFRPDSLMLGRLGKPPQCGGPPPKLLHEVTA